VIKSARAARSWMYSTAVIPLARSTSKPASDPLFRG
jgi:hypothetical protein